MTSRNVEAVLNEHDHGYAKSGVNGFAVASLVLGVLWVFGLGSLLAIIFGHIGRSQIRREGGTGAGMALAGLVLGYLAFLLFILLLATGGGSIHFEVNA